MIFRRKVLDLFGHGAARLYRCGLICLLALACTKPAPPRADTGFADSGIINDDLDATIIPDAAEDGGVLVPMEAGVNPDAAAPDTGVFTYPETLTLRSEGGTTYRHPMAIASDPNNASLIYFSAITLDGHAAIFQLDDQGQTSVIFSGEPLVLPVDILVSSNGRSLYIADLAAGEHGSVYRIDLRLRTIEVYAAADDLWDPAGLAFDKLTPALLITGRFPDTELGSVWELLPGEITPAAIPFGPDFTLNDPSHLTWRAANETLYVYDAHDTLTEKGQIYAVTPLGDFTLIADNIESNYPASIELSLEETYLLVGTSTQTAGGGDTIHVVDLRNTPPTRRPLSLGQRIKEPRAIHRIENTNRWLIIDARGGSANQGAIYQLE